MKLSTNTVQVLKNFASINQNLVIQEGNEIKTMSAMKNIVAKATVEETFPKQVAIYDLNEFLGCLSLFKNPILTFNDTSVTITEENDGNGDSLEYMYSDPSVVTTPSKDITMPSEEISFTLTDAMLSKLSKSAGMIGAPDLLLENKDDLTIIYQALKSLPERQRMVLSLYYFEEMKLREIGELLGVTESRVSQIHAQAVQSLKPLLKDLH